MTEKTGTTLSGLDRPAARAAARGLENVVMGETRLSCVDGAAGRLVIAGFPVEELAPRARYEEALFLLWHDRLPTARELAELEAELAQARPLRAPVLDALRAAAAAALDPMDALRLGLATLPIVEPALARIEPGSRSEGELRHAGLVCTAATSSIVAAYHRLRRGEAPIDPDPALGHAANHLWMARGVRPEASAARALETYLVTTIDHGMNASTFAARVVVSTRSDLVSALCAAVGALKGPLHGGAPGPALDLVLALREIARTSGRPLAALAEEEISARLRAGIRLMGFGHRVYRVRDPRADVLSEALGGLAPDPERDAFLLDALTVERVALDLLARHRPGRAIATNVELYTALLLYALGLPAELFTPTFAAARVAG